jgi:hypothetical protein
MRFMTTPRARRRAIEKRMAELRIAELRLALSTLGPAPADAIGRWRHQEEVWRIEREIELLARRRRRTMEQVPA